MTLTFLITYVEPAINSVFAAPSVTGDGVTSSGQGCKDISLTDPVGPMDPHYVAVLEPFEKMQGLNVESHVNFEDLPFDHKSHDFNFFLILDDIFKKKHSNSNDRIDPKNPNSPQMMEMEWEIGTVNDGRTDRFPKEFWPSDGDTVTMEGRYIFDCGHPPPHTEIHPPSMVAFTHFEPIISQFLGNGNEPMLSSKTTIYIMVRGDISIFP